MAAEDWMEEVRPLHDLYEQIKKQTPPGATLAGASINHQHGTGEVHINFTYTTDAPKCPNRETVDSSKP